MEPVLQKTRDWARESLLLNTIPYWYTNSFKENGFFYPDLDRQWENIGEGYGSLVSQSRLIYIFSAGYRHSGNSKYLEVVRRGTEFLRRYFKDPQYPGWYWSVNPDGSVRSDKKDSYGHAFVIFGLAHASKVLQDEELLEAALETLREMKEFMVDSEGGYYRTVSREGKEGEKRNPKRSQNPMMHLFEAHLVLLEAGAKRKEVTDSAEDIARFLHCEKGKSKKEGSLPEVYDKNWHPLDEAAGGRIEIGHQLEWAFLLSRSVELGLSHHCLSLAEILFQHALRMGESPTGGVYSHERLDHTGPVDSDMKWWQQCELIRVLVHFIKQHNAHTLIEKLPRHIKYFQDNLQDSEYGGTFRTPRDQITGPGWDHKGTVWKIDYHSVSMWDEILRVLK